MTPKETLEKYGLKTDAMSIAGRLLNDIYRKMLKDLHPDMSNEELMKAAKECKSADLELICVIALKGEQALTELEQIKATNEELKDTIFKIYEVTRRWVDDVHADGNDSMEQIKKILEDSKC